MPLSSQTTYTTSCNGHQVSTLVHFPSRKLVCPGSSTSTGISTEAPKDMAQMASVTQSQMDRFPRFLAPVYVRVGVKERPRWHMGYRKRKHAFRQFRPPLLSPCAITRTALEVPEIDTTTPRSTSSADAMATSRSSRQWQLTCSRGSSRSGGAPSQLTACFVAETLETGELQRYVYDRLQPTYGNRYRRMLEAINQHLIPLGVRVPQTDREVVGGYFIWLTLPSPLKGAVVAQRAKEDENLAVAQVSTSHDHVPNLESGCS